MGYCFMSIDKLHSLGELTAKYNHNYRKIEVENADPSLSKNNQELVKLPVSKATGEQLGYAEAFRQRLTALPYYKNHAIRKGGVFAYEIVMTYSRDENLDIDSWKKKNVTWLQNTFNKSPDGKSNVLSVVFHADEPGNVHCHAIVVPIDERGRLNASRFTDGWKAMTDLQNSYAEEMREFGLQRGLQGGQARHKDIKKYYADLNNAKHVPEPKQNETADMYRDRILEDLETLQLASKRKRDLEEAAHKKKLAEERINQREMIQQEAKISKKIASLEVKDLHSEKKELQKDISLLKQQKNELNESVEHLADQKQLEKKATFYDEFQHRMELLMKHDPDKAQELQDILRTAKEYQIQMDTDQNL